MFQVITKDSSSVLNRQPRRTEIQGITIEDSAGQLCIFWNWMWKSKAQTKRWGPKSEYAKIMLEKNYLFNVQPSQFPLHFLWGIHRDVPCPITGYRIFEQYIQTVFLYISRENSWRLKFVNVFFLDVELKQKFFLSPFYSEYELLISPKFNKINKMHAFWHLEWKQYLASMSSRECQYSWLFSWLPNELACEGEKIKHIDCKRRIVKS